MTGLLTIYESLIRMAGPVLGMLLHARAKRGKEDRERMNERMGKPSRPRPQGRIVWVHAASVGEAQSALILINAMVKTAPDVHIVVTTGTVTSATLMERRLPSNAFHQYVPLDHPVWVRSFLDHWQPNLALWMESELWPNMLSALQRRNIPSVLVNARLSDRSFRNWNMVRGTAARILGCFHVVLAQTTSDAGRFRDLGAANVIVGDNLKYGAAPLPYDDLSLAALSLTVEERKTWVYASTHDGEEELACRVHKALRETIPSVLTIIVPRHPERREEIAQTCFRNGLKFRLRSQNAALPSPDDDIYIADTLGELGLFYKLCPIAMIGRSFSKDGGGGHNPVEAAQRGCAVLTGPHNKNQRQLYDDMEKENAVIELKTEGEMIATLRDLFNDDARLHALQERAAAFVNRKSHVADNVLSYILPYLKPSNTDRSDAA